MGAHFDSCLMLLCRVVPGRFTGPGLDESLGLSSQGGAAQVQDSAVTC